ncbi:hypothetical protein LTR36_003481 [Oleoguttula mirabilis]|uniref:Uncharacterized protein n=1 Tax=Oleoguttula mirabilis TaxID=1507867 RepID=A0AAV9JJA0_9PEZI|nr:hypothetical protein LTR36_003481 [Oleoguttula mirabilis]
MMEAPIYKSMRPVFKGRKNAAPLTAPPPPTDDEERSAKRRRIVTLKVPDLMRWPVRDNDRHDTTTEGVSLSGALQEAVQIGDGLQQGLAPLDALVSNISLLQSRLSQSRGETHKLRFGLDKTTTWLRSSQALTQSQATKLAVLQAEAQEAARGQTIAEARNSILVGQLDRLQSEVRSLEHEAQNHQRVKAAAQKVVQHTGGDWQTFGKAIDELKGTVAAVKSTQS